MFRTANPMLNNAAFRDGSSPGLTPGGANTMTIGSTVAKSSLLIGVCAATAAGAFTLTQDNPGLYLPLVLGGSILSLILVLITCFNPKASPVTALPVAIAEGAFAGAFSFMVTRFLPQNEAGEYVVASPEGTIFGALLLTMSIAGGLLGGYSMGLIRPNNLFRNCVVAGTIGIGLFALIAMGMGLFGNSSLISVYDPSNGGLISIGFSLFVTVLASANLVLDFETIHNGVRNNAPKYMEWYGAQTLLVTLVWLYINVLKLLVKLANRD